jgi:hypothetical protein
MYERGERPNGEVGEGTDDEWAVANNPAMRAVLDHVAEELAAEFVRLMKAAVSMEDAEGPQEENR